MNTESNQNIIDTKLSKNEKKELKLLNSKSNLLRKEYKKNEDPLNMSIREFTKKWADTNIFVLIDLTNFLGNLSEYKNHFDDIDDTQNWIKGFNRIFKKFYKIITKEQRPIFIGFTMVLISFALHIIQITS
tara:strand:- start:180 stop:572 length:393 start_codon:yes stop_codon:yes gene_type:complete